MTAEVELRCLQLRVKGKTYEEIALEVGVHWETAMDAVERVLLRTRGKADALADRARDIELRRCDAIIASFWDRATDPAKAKVEVPANTETGARDYDGQDRAADRLLKAMERRAKLLGLDAPGGAQVQVNVMAVAGVPDITRGSGAVVPVLVRLAATGHREDAVLDLHRSWLQALLDGDVVAARDPAGWVLDRARAVEAPALPGGGG